MLYCLYHMNKYIKRIKQDFFGISMVVIFTLFILLGCIKYFVLSDYDILLHVPCDNSSAACVSNGEDSYRKVITSAVLAESYSKCLSGSRHDCVDSFLEDSRVKILDCKEFLEEDEVCE